MRPYNPLGGSLGSTNYSFSNAISLWIICCFVPLVNAVLLQEVFNHHTIKFGSLYLRMYLGLLNGLITSSCSFWVEHSRRYSSDHRLLRSMLYSFAFIVFGRSLALSMDHVSKIPLIAIRPVSRLRFDGFIFWRISQLSTNLISSGRIVGNQNRIDMKLYIALTS